MKPKLGTKTTTHFYKIKLFIEMQMYSAKHTVDLMKSNANYLFFDVFSSTHFIITGVIYLITNLYSIGRLFHTFAQTDLIYFGNCICVYIY